MPVFIQSRVDGFRRCGVAHSAMGKEWPDAFFTREQLNILNNDQDIVMVAGVDPALELEPGTEDLEPAPDRSSWEKALALATCIAIEDGCTVQSGAPTVDVMEEILGEGITSAQRNHAWDAWKQENN